MGHCMWHLPTCVCFMGYLNGFPITRYKAQRPVMPGTYCECELLTTQAPRPKIFKEEIRGAAGPEED